VNRTRASVAALIVLLVVSALTTVPTATAAGGTWTRVTSPAAPGHNHFTYVAFGVVPTMTVSGQASDDVANVNIYCFFEADQSYQGPLNGSSPIAVNTSTSPHSFTATGVHVPGIVAGCVLRAVPDTYTGLSSGTNSGYVAAFAGPSVYYGQFTVMKSSAGKVIHTASESANPGAFVSTGTPDQTGVLELQHNDSTRKRATGTPAVLTLATTKENAVPASDSPSHSEIVVDGVSAYMPAALDSYVSDHALVPSISARMSRSKSTGAITTVETIPLRTCGTTYPVSPPCTPKKPGVAMRRSIVTSHAGAVLTVRDVFSSTDHKRHAVRVEYLNNIAPLTSAQPGVRLPGHAWRPVPTNLLVTKLPVGPHTIFLTTDLNATDGDPGRADLGFTYSGRPSVLFDDNHQMAFRYSRTVRATAPSRMTFAMETAASMSPLSSLAAAQQHAFAPHVTLSGPHETTADNTPVVRGKVTNATNGLPAKVRVTIGSRSKTVAVGPAGGFAVTWPSLANGKHTVRVRATDPSGLVLRTARTFKVI
jgi:hypothetical protein